MAMDRATVAGANHLHGLISRRVHNRGLDHRGKRIGLNSKRKGSYSPGWRRERLAKGRQVKRIDMEYESDLRRHFRMVIDDKGVRLSVLSELQIAKLEGAEKRYKTKIYDPMPNELSEAKEVFIRIFRQELQKELRA